MTEPTAAVPVNVARLLDEGQWTGTQKVLLLLAALAFAVDGFANQVLGLAIPAMIPEWHVTRAAFSPVLAFGLGGLAIGTMLGGMLGDRFGRRPALLSAVLFFGAMTAAISLISTMHGLIIMRIFSGLGLGAAVPCAASLIAEYTPARKRSLAITIGMVFIPLGGVISGAAAARLMPGNDWRGLFLLAGCTALLVAVLLFFTLPESPRFLLKHSGRHDELHRLMARFGHHIDPKAELVDDDTGGKKAVPIRQLFAAGMTRDTLSIWAAFFCCLLATYTVQSWGPTALQMSGVSPALVGKALAIFGLGGIIGSLASGAVIDRIGSRATIMAFAALAIIMALWLGTTPLSALAGNSLAIRLGVFGLMLSGIQSPLYALAANIYQPSCRATGVGMGSAMGRVGAMASSFTGVMSFNYGGTQGYFLFLGLVVLACLMAILPIRNHIAARK